MQASNWRRPQTVFQRPSSGRVGSGRASFAKMPKSPKTPPYIFRVFSPSMRTPIYAPRSPPISDLDLRAFPPCWWSCRPIITHITHATHTRTRQATSDHSPCAGARRVKFLEALHNRLDGGSKAGTKLVRWAFGRAANECCLRFGFFIRIGRQVEAEHPPAVSTVDIYL